MQRAQLAVIVIALSVPTVAAAQPRKMDEVKEPDKGAAMSSWTAAQMWWPDRANVSTHGYGSAFGMLVLADEMGDKLPETARASLIDRCFEYAQKDATSTLTWALCGPDVKALDLKKLDAQLAADNITPESRTEIVEDAAEIQAKAKAVGDAVEAAAKDDPGVAAVLKLTDTAKAEWAAYLGKNKTAFDRYVVLKDAVRSGKSNNKGFAGCWEATQPAFVKLVKATKFPWEVPGDYMPGYMRFLLTTPESYITTASFAACAYSVHESGEALVAAVSNQDSGGVKVGWRTLAVAKAIDPSFQPKFAERSLSLQGMQRSWQRHSVKMDSVNDIASIQTPAQGVVATAKANGDVTKLTFKGDKVEACLQWVDSRKVSNISAGGTVNYEKTCKKRGMVANQETATEVGTKFAAGLAPGVNVLIVYKFPVVVWKGKKFVAIFGVPYTAAPAK